MGIFTKKSSDLPRRRQADVRQPYVETQDNLFKRNRTLTGSTSDQLTNTHHATDLESPRTHAHHLAIRRRKVGTTLLIVVIGAAILFWIITQLTAQVSIAVTDSSLSQPLNDQRYQTVIEHYLDIHPIARLRFALNSNDLTDYVIGALPEIQTIRQQAGSSLGDTTFILTMRRPVAGWSINGKQYYVDTNGVAFDQNYFATPSVQIVDNSGVTPVGGDAVASNQFLSFVGRIVSQSKQYGYTVTQAILPVGTTRELDIHVSTIATTIKLSVDRPAGEQAEDMSRALKYLASKSETPSYVDVRVSGKAYYQ